MSLEIPVVSARERTPLDPSITPAQINLLVESFYGKVRAHETLGPIFLKEMGDDWGPHLNKMKHFWASVLLKTGTYKGKPVPAHARIEGVSTENFHEWMDLFEDEVYAIFSKEAAPQLLATAQRIAQSLWLAMVADPFATPPKKFGSQAA
ncbi:group III truncated hemoglobin [Pseudovibrio sp. Tun.PSC04-5.I4]|uniref:group III truncated hemoglobin n=1 Tax=Pseudovibrio sp. Tun.PSC04-5.I4 TaxID=1798213 RepID=UPI00088FDCC4|nr:group III truncated hemoglobin [Pseudovibrio sp. Tun.PSC04-5.I4]SDQ78422.1 hemoglobin [Pseudovibrio sp. Tun.PSC04-5.I4]